MKLSYVLDEAGWARAIISDAGQQREMNVTYLSNSLSDMARAAILLLEGSDSVRFSFDDEPGEHRCIVKRTNESDAHICVLWFEELWSGLPDERGTEVFSCTCTVARFCGEVLSCLQCLLEEHGTGGYKEKWLSHEFPSTELKRLRELISARRRTAA
jgi:hypothetical protein